MTIIYRTEKGSPLTVQEIDDNFRELETRLTALEDHPEVGEGIGKIHIEGDHISFRGTFGTDFGTFTLPKATLNLRGDWAPQTPYKKLDLITIDKALYWCLQDHMSTIWVEDNSFWKQVFSLPQPPPPTLSLYEKASLPETETLGKLALLVENETSTLIFFNGNTWQRLMKGESL